MFVEGRNITFSQMKNFCILQGSEVTFILCDGKGVTVSFRNNVNNLKYVSIIPILLKNNCLGFSKVKWLQYTVHVRWADVQAIDVKFSRD